MLIVKVWGIGEDWVLLEVELILIDKVEYGKGGMCVVKGKGIIDEYGLLIEGYDGRGEVWLFFDLWLGDLGGVGEMGI